MIIYVADNSQLSTLGLYSLNAPIFKGTHTVKNIDGKKTLVSLANYSILPSFFANLHNFHNIPYGNRLQFAKVFLPNFLQSLFAKLFYRQSFLLYGNF